VDNRAGSGIGGGSTQSDELAMVPPVRRSGWAIIGSVAVLASPLGVGSAAGVLPRETTLHGSVAGGGAFTFRVRNHEVVLMRGRLPRRHSYRCALAASGSVSYRIPNRDPIGNHFTIRAHQTLARRHGGVRSTRLFMTGRFDSTFTHGHGVMRLVVVDPGGRCASPLLSWRIPPR
jgi:hypothetical protein